MNEGWPILSLVTFLPLVGAGFIFLIKGDAETVAKNARAAALWTSLITFLLSLLLWTEFDPKNADFQFLEVADWIPAFGINFAVRGANLDVMEADTKRMRGDRPYVFADMLRRRGLPQIIAFIETAGGLVAREMA